MRILLVTQRFRPLIGGAESVLWELARELVRQNHVVTVITARWEPAWPPEERVDGVEILRIPFQKVRFWGTWRFMRALKRWLLQRGSGYDVWYVSMLKHCAWTAVGAAWRCHVPVVLRPEGAGPSGDIAWADRAIGGKLIRRRCRSAAAFVAIGSHVRDDMERAAFVKNRIHDIPNGVRLPAVAGDVDKAVWRQRLGLHSTAPLAVFVGRLSPEKGLIDLIAAWKQVQAELPEAQLAIVGTGPQEGELRTIAADQPNIVWVGATTQPQRYLHAADVFVLPSHEEGMSIALLEAMAAGVPIVATDIPGNRELIESGRDGLLVSMARPALLAKSIVLQLQDKDRAAGMAHAARTRVQERFSIALMAQRHVELFRSLASSKKQPSTS